MAPEQICSLNVVAKNFYLFSTKMHTAVLVESVDKNVINGYLKEINSLDFKTTAVKNNVVIKQFIERLCQLTHPIDTSLVENFTWLLRSLIQIDYSFDECTSAACIQWLKQIIEFSNNIVHHDVLLTLHSALSTEMFSNSAKNLEDFISHRNQLFKFINDPIVPWNETSVLALRCIQVILLKKRDDRSLVLPEFNLTTAHVISNIIISLDYKCQDKLVYNKTICLCLHILHILVVDYQILSQSPDEVGKLFGAVQTYMYHGIKGYQLMKPEPIRPATMNLPETVYTMPCIRNFSRKPKGKSQQTRKFTSDSLKSSTRIDSKPVCRCSSDSDTSENEIVNLDRIESKVRFEAIHLLQGIARNISSREIFGYWPQIVANDSTDNVRVLSRYILREPVSKNRQTALSTLTELLDGARSFLLHAEDVERPSFVAFCSTVSAMIKELHLALSLLLNTERNMVLRMHGLKCVAALARSTPYARLKPGLATKLVRNCRSQIHYKDLFKIWLEQIFYPNLGPDTVLLINSWSEHCD
ncbi:HEAT repeat-containing protein 6 isoform X1 [Orussus abietinus]|uniref:HEAT repeat-containing protein 6 isoform X1 n=1 Tax=Orussus abietinus TaxID=222816 RepID=UPI000C7161DA|nr:HEAT repeat-containing protein 6 isoform X1 [Orussus abietinus]